MLGLLPLLPQAPGTGRKGQMQPEDAMTSLVRLGACGGACQHEGSGAVTIKRTRTAWRGQKLSGGFSCLLDCRLAAIR